MGDHQAGVTKLLKLGEPVTAQLSKSDAQSLPEPDRLARSYIRKERDGSILQTTAFVNEAFLRLVDVKHVQWQDRAHFLAISANIKPRILVDRARAQGMDKRGNDAQHVNLGEAPELAWNPRSQSLVAVDDALQQLERVDPRKAQVVELKFFGGLGVEETARYLECHRRPQCATGRWLGPG